MAIERTLSIIKPDAVAKNVIGEIYARFEKAGLKIVAAKMLQLDDESAGGFYAEHKERPFYKDLIEFMTSGPVMVTALEGEGAVMMNRDLDGCHEPGRGGGRNYPRRLSRILSMPTQFTALIRQHRQQREVGYFFNDNEICS